MRRVRPLELLFNGNAACAKAGEIDVNILLREKFHNARADIERERVTIFTALCKEINVFKARNCPRQLWT